MSDFYGKKITIIEDGKEEPYMILDQYGHGFMAVNYDWFKMKKSGDHWAMVGYEHLTVKPKFKEIRLLSRFKISSKVDSRNYFIVEYKEDDCFVVTIEAFTYIYHHLGKWYRLFTNDTVIVPEDIKLKIEDDQETTEIDKPIDYQILDKVYGKRTVEFFHYLGVTHFIDVNKFIEVKGYSPNISSIFMYGEGGSYDFGDVFYGDIFIHNGTLTPKEPRALKSNGKEYYLEQFGTELNLEF